MYPIFRQIDAVVSECLVSPMFVSLAMLMDEEADDKDIQVSTETSLSICFVSFPLPFKSKSNLCSPQIAKEEQLHKIIIIIARYEVKYRFR